MIWTSNIAAGTKSGWALAPRTHQFQRPYKNTAFWPSAEKLGNVLEECKSKKLLIFYNLNTGGFGQRVMRLSRLHQGDEK